MLNGGSCGSTRLAAAEERINCALADAVERLPTKDPGMRDMLKRPSIVCLIQSQGPNTGTGDVTRKVRTRPTKDVTRASSSDDTGYDVSDTG